MHVRPKLLIYPSVIIIVLLATTPLHEMHSGPYVFGSQGVINETNGWPDGLAFLFGLLSVQWTMTVSRWGEGKTVLANAF